MLCTLSVLLQREIYQGMAIIEINSKIDTGAFARVQHAVRATTLDFIGVLPNTQLRSPIVLQDAQICTFGPVGPTKQF